MSLRKMMNDLNLEETIQSIEMDLIVERARVSWLEDLLSEAKDTQRLREMVERGYEKLESIPGKIPSEEAAKIMGIPEKVIRRALYVRSERCEFHRIKKPAELRTGNLLKQTGKVLKRKGKIARK